jgi:hypothetical protein
LTLNKIEYFSKVSWSLLDDFFSRDKGPFPAYFPGNASFFSCKKYRSSRYCVSREKGPQDMLFLGLSPLITRAVFLRIHVLEALVSSSKIHHQISVYVLISVDFGESWAPSRC